MKKVIGSGAKLLCAGLIYAFLLIPMGLVIPCPYRLLTGRLCPGCGVTRMCLALLHGRFAEAWGYNRGLVLALPAIGLLVLTALYRYVRAEQAKAWTAGLERILSVILIVYLILWGIVRNQYGI